MVRVTIGTADAKAKVIDLIAQGAKVDDAMAAVQRQPKSYENWRSVDKEFAAKVDDIRAQRKSAKDRGVDGELRTLSFAEWRLRFLNQDTYRHQQAWIDLLEGKGYEPLEGEKYVPGWPNRLLVNTPPFHAKSMTITIEYVTYRICMNPNIKVIIVSKKQEQAKKFLYAIKQRLSSSAFAGIQAAYAPDGGFKADRFTGSTWSANMIYVAGRDSGEKDPTVEALGIGGQIYGARADLIILDDCITLGNAAEYEKQIDWLNQEVSSRAKNGKILVVGTRVAPIDFYSELMNGDRYLSGKSPWTYLAQPAVLKYDDTPDDWVTLWPRSSRALEEDGEGADADGTYRAWDGQSLYRVREQVPPRTWSLVYMQQPISEDAVFNPVCISGSTNKRRKPGTLKAGAWGHPDYGMEGQYVIASMDPAMSGDTFTLVAAIDRKTMTRRIMQCWVKTAPTPQYIRDLIANVTDEYGVNEWVIEQNAFQLFLVHDEEINRYCMQRGVRITPHYTSRNKQDPDFGVASIAPLFGTIKRHEGSHRVGMDHAGDNLIELPDPDMSEGVKALIEQLMTWQPGKLGKELKQDGPMALWFMELRARAILGIGRQKRRSFMDNPYLSRGDRDRQIVVPMEAYRYAEQA